MTTDTLPPPANRIDAGLAVATVRLAWAGVNKRGVAHPPQRSLSDELQAPSRMVLHRELRVTLAEITAPRQRAFRAPGRLWRAEQCLKVE